MATPVTVREGHPNNWPRKIARKHLFAIDAVLALRKEMNEANEKFALVEFTEEREKLVRLNIRTALLEAIAEWRRSADPGERNEKTMGADAAVCAFVEAINRICPEEG